MTGRRSIATTTLLLAAFAVAADDTLDAVFPQTSIVIEASQDGCYRFQVHVARDIAQQRRGLMHVRNLEGWSGMLFVYDDEAMRSMWMKNTYIPLDILFADTNGVIRSIATDTEPLSLASIRSGQPARFVLELNAGTADRLSIRPGDRLYWAGDSEAVPLQD